MTSTTIQPRVTAALSSAPLFGVWSAILIHVVWAVTLLASATAGRATAIHGLTSILPRYIVITLLAVVVASALYGVHGGAVGSPTHRVWRVASLIPQQLLLGVSSFSALYAMWVGHFADGVMRSREFLVADQSYIIVAFLIHSATIVFIAAAPWRGR